MKKLWFSILCLFSIAAYAQSSSLNLQLPSVPSTYGQDSIRSSDGVDCKNAIGGATNFEIGMTGIVDNYQSPFGGNGEDATKNIGVYARIVIPLDGPAERINCNSLYQLELRKKRLEVLKLQEEIEMLKRLKSGEGFEN